MKRIGLLATICLVLIPMLAPVGTLAGSSPAQPVKTNKQAVITIAVQGRVAPAEPSPSYLTTWDGKPKMAIGTGGINYNLRIGDRVFGWAAGDRATVGVATVGTGSERAMNAWTYYASIGNDVRVLTGDAKGQKGVVIAKFGSYVLLHFDDATLDKLKIDDTFHVRAEGVGLEIEGFKDVILHGIAPHVLEQIAGEAGPNALEVPVVKEIPAEIIGQGPGRGSLSGHYNIQTSFPPDIKKYGLDELRFGDLVLLRDIQTDYGMGYYKGGSTLGVVCSGPSDISGLGIGVTPVLSTRSVTIKARLDSSANIGKYLGLAMRSPTSNVPAPDFSFRLPNGSNGHAASAAPGFTTNKDQLIVTAVEGVVQPAGSGGYSTTWDGKPKLDIGMASINYTVSVGDLASGWASTDHVEPDVTIQGRDKPRPSDCALAILACIGNEARIVSGDAKGAKGVFIGRHAGSDDLVWFPKDAVDKLTIDDKIQIRARGVGLKIDGFADVRVNKIAPELLENLGITVEGGRLVVPVVLEVPGHLMGSGMGGSFLENVDYDVQTTDPATVDQYKLKTIRIGDLIAIRDHYDYWGRGRYEGAVTIAVVVHGWSDYAGHGPGMNPILSALPGRIVTRIDPHSNIAYALGIKTRPASNRRQEHP